VGRDEEQNSHFVDIHHTLVRSRCRIRSSTRMSWWITIVRIPMRSTGVQIGPTVVTSKNHCIIKSMGIICDLPSVTSVA
jgi:hypothetical protein